MTQHEEISAEKGFRIVPCSVTERAEILDRLRWMQDLGWSQVEILARYLELFRVDSGTVMMCEGDKADYLGLVVKGQACVYKEDRSKRRRRFTTLGAGQAFGEMSLIDGQPRSATVVAVSEVLLLALSHKDFDLLLDEHPKLGVEILLKLARMMSQRLRLTSGVLADALSSEKRVDG